uniref:Reverse transcriptase domain-containing protein n=1 Tax=Tanacetum cinerariifolium TaxID=118510 RepID=A0A6L2KC98_TANCI|nr:reverse transcriptase domain-containing protein [Tanacetum cinerariifolium]
MRTRKQKTATKVLNHGERKHSQIMKTVKGALEVKIEKKKSSIKEDDLSQPWICEETDPFTPRVRYFDLPNKTRMPSNVKTYDGSDDPKDHLKIFQAAAKVERWAMPTWCHMFNSTLTGSARVWFDDLPSKSVNSYDDLKKAFLANFLQQKKCIKDPVEIYHIKQKEGESIEDFEQRFKTESMHAKGPPECIRISIFMHGIIHPELIKRLHDKNQKSVDEMMRVTTAFLRGEVAASNQELKQGNEKDQPKAAKKGETFRKDKALAILMVRPWKSVAKQRITQSFSPNPEISFPPLEEEDGTKGPMIIEAEVGGHFIHLMYLDGRSALKILYEHCFNRLRPKVKNQMVPATIPLVGLSGEIIWPMGADITASEDR